jgi:hypothetical protein
MRAVLLPLVIATACEVHVERRGGFDQVLAALSDEIGERIVIDQCPELPARGTVMCRAHLASGPAFDLEVTRSADRLDLRTPGMAAGSKAARALYTAFRPRGLELGDMRCPALFPAGADRWVSCTGTVDGVPIEVRAAAAGDQWKFELVRGVVGEEAVARLIATRFAGGADADIDCGFDLRLSVPGSRIACDVRPRDGAPAWLAWVDIQDVDGSARVTDLHPSL